MSSSLVGFLLKGPTEFTKAQIADAVSRARAIIDEADRLLSVYNDEMFWGCVSSRLPPTSNPELYDAWQNNELDVYDGLDPEHEVQDFVDFWIGGGADEYNVHSRTDPDDPKSQWLFTGEITGGDAPEGGFAIVERASKLGIWEPLNIR